MEIDTSKFKKLLDQELIRLEKDLSSIALKDPDNPDVWILKPEEEHEAESDKNDAADDIEEFDTNNSILAELADRYRDVVIALEKIEEGSYGIDEVDGEPIPLDRLAVNPSARTKVENADKLED